MEQTTNNNAEKVSQPVINSVAQPAPQVAAAPAENSALPNKNAAVPEYRLCLASDSTITEDAINAVLVRGANKEE